MVFNSLEFTIFLIIFLSLYYAIYKHLKSRDILLLLGSYIFYMAWYWQYAGLIVLSTVVDYWIGKKLSKENKSKKRKILLLVSLFVNLGVLAIFKYYNFFYESSQIAMAWFGISIPSVYHQLLLPVGISFYTFQTLSYTIDVYRKDIDFEPSFIKFAVFVSFFPQLVAGPIVRAKDFLPQINKSVVVSQANINRGMWMIFAGLFKKIVIADMLAYLVVDGVFENPRAFSSLDLMVSLYAYTFQIYCDFSGYSDIAIGVALLLGFHLPINFNRPYLAQSPSDFWKRWHISLSSWLRDYLYISLGGNRGTRIFTGKNLFLTMLLGGLWHGAAWNFVIWGAFHGIILILLRDVKVEKNVNLKMLVKIIVNFHLVVFGWLLFRASDMNAFADYIDGLSRLTGGTQLSLLAYGVLCFAALLHFTPKAWIHEELMGFIFRRSVYLQAVTYSMLLFFFVGASINSATFIYFRF